jgi:uncharacterized membrane protein
MIALLFLGAALAVMPPAPHWGGLNTGAANALKAEGIRQEMYEHLAAGEVLTEQRPVPAGKTGVHLASFGIVRGPAERVWNAVTDCGRTPGFMPHIDSCALVQPDHALLPNQRWEELGLSFRILFFKKTARIVNEATMEAPNFLGWKQVGGDGKENQGYYRIITIAAHTQLVVFDTLCDPGASVPGFVKNWIIKNSMPGVIEGLRQRVEAQEIRHVS